MFRFVFSLSLLFSLSLFANNQCSGKQAPEEGACSPKILSLENISKENSKITNKDLDGKVVFLHFWATWCQPCAEELPALEQLFLSLDAEDIVFLPVSIDTAGKPAIDRFFKRLFKGKYPAFDVYLDQKKLTAAQFEAFKVPETFIIDRTGRITDKIVGKRDWNDSIIRHYLKLLSQKK